MHRQRACRSCAQCSQLSQFAYPSAMVKNQIIWQEKLASAPWREKKRKIHLPNCNGTARATDGEGRKSKGKVFHLVRIFSFCSRFAVVLVSWCLFLFQAAPQRIRSVATSNWQPAASRITKLFALGANYKTPAARSSHQRTKGRLLN